MPYTISRSYIPAIIMLAVAVSVAGIDIYIASLPYMQRYFNTTEEVMQFSISASIIGSSIITIFLGQMADAYGRRKILIIFQILFCISSILTAFSPNIEILNSLRLISGITSTAAFVIGFVIIGDLFDEEKASRYYAYLTTTLLIALILAPIIGGYFAEHDRWDYSFLFMGGVAAISSLTLWMFLPETLNKKKTFSILKILGHNKQIILDPKFLNLTLVQSMLMGGILSFFSNASFYYIDVLGLSPGTYAKHQVAIMIANLVGSALTPKFFRYFGLPTTLKIALTIATVGALSFIFAGAFAFSTPSILTITAGTYIFGSGLSFITATAIVLNAFPDERATVSSMISFVRGSIMVICISVGSFLYHGKAIHMAYALLLYTIISLLLYLKSNSQKKVVSA